ncbi:UPF0280 family protein [Archaeoglobales archaeon]|nr:MAG: UPF0280 family protein [Archaeoglobales archaeon]
MKDYKRFRFRHKETIVTILVEREEYYRVAIKAILKARKQIENHISKDPFFLTALEPYDCNADGIVKRMCEAAKIAGVGPMASVAGAIAGYAVDKTIEAGAEFIVVDNGGDIAINSDRELTVGIFPTNLAFKIGGKICICTSSGKIGHSISFGYADAVTIFSKDCCIADAFATALANEIKENFKQKEIENTLEKFWVKAKNYVNGAIIVKDEYIGFIGNIPTIVEAEVD